VLTSIPFLSRYAPIDGAGHSLIYPMARSRSIDDPSVECYTFSAKPLVVPVKWHVSDAIETRALDSRKIVAVFVASQLQSNDVRMPMPMPMRRQSRFYRHVVVGLLVINRLFTSDARDARTIVRHYYFSLYTPFINSLKMLCCVCDASPGPLVELLSLVQSASNVVVVCERCTQLCTWTAESKTACANYCATCHQMLCRRCEPLYRCAHCRDYYCDEHMLIDGWCERCVHAVDLSIVPATLLCREADRHTETGHHYDHLCLCRLCDHYVCEDDLYESERICRSCARRLTADHGVLDADDYIDFVAENFCDKDAATQEVREELAALNIRLVSSHEFRMRIYEERWNRQNLTRHRFNKYI
jgi:hypothetical protein